MHSLNPSRLARIVATLLSLLASTMFLASMVEAQTAAASVAPAGLLPREPDSETIPSGKTPGEVLDGRANLLRHYEPTRMLRVVFALKPRNWERHQQLLDDLHDKQSPLFHQFLTAEEWNARFAPAPEDEQALATRCRRVRCSPSRRSVPSGRYSDAAGRDASARSRPPFT